MLIIGKLYKNQVGYLEYYNQPLLNNEETESDAIQLEHGEIVLFLGLEKIDSNTYDLKFLYKNKIIYTTYNFDIYQFKKQVQKDFKEITT